MVLLQGVQRRYFARLNRLPDDDTQGRSGSSRFRAQPPTLAVVPVPQPWSFGCQIDQNTNAFWRLVSEITGEDLRALEYEQRLSALLRHGYGLWDVVAEASRSGSLDSNILDHTKNDLQGLIDTLPSLHSIVFNGGTAAKLGLNALGSRANDYRIFSLPSTSPAYTLAYAISTLVQT